MTFFANAGVKWPSVESQLRQAGTNALSGGAELWQLFSRIESWEFDRVDTVNDEDEIKHRCVNALGKAADAYSKSLDGISPLLVDGLTPAELDLASIPRRYYDGYDYPYLGGSINIPDLYAELVTRIRNLASLVRTFDLRNDRNDLALQVFRAMQQWELISLLARLIAVVNRRPNALRSSE
ncbi:hypothetical protein ACM43_16000 [Bradyrhizobium sp. CCBAU 45321]|nr:hypothetical protein [Bradyrhizobium sp. CCBAU 45321]